jgi:3-hydroxybutyryl-CoA dehydrogenase
MSHDIILIGSGPLVENIERWLTSQSFRVFYPDGYGGEAVVAAVAVDALVTEEEKERLVRLEAMLPANVPVFVSTLHRTVTEIASWLKHPERVAGFSPLFLERMPLVEVSRPLQAEDDPAWEERLSFWKDLDKEVEVVGDEPGLVFPRTLALLVNEAAFTLGEGIANVQDIDLAMRKGTNYPLGPLEWADEAGIDQIVAILSGLHREYGEDRYRPAPLLRKMMYAGWLGKAAGRGFYRHDGQGG